MEQRRTAEFLLRLGLAFVFLYAAFSAWVIPEAWIGFFPIWLRNVLSPKLLLWGFSSFETLLALWLLSGFRIFYAALTAAAMLAGIVVFNFGAMDIVFRDVGILFAALALASASRSR